MLNQCLRAAMLFIASSIPAGLLHAVSPESPDPASASSSGQTKVGPALAKKAADGPLEYNRDIKPILAEYCFACHGTDEESRAADLRLDIPDDAIDFGVIVPNESDESELVVRLYEEDPDLIMPPPESHKVLSKEQKELLVRWIDVGAIYENHWSLEPPKTTELDEVEDKHWNKNLIDRHVHTRLSQEGLKPADPADPNRLFRRLHLDITGLPPKPTDAAAFEIDYARDAEVAVEEWVDRLMQQPSYGEHRARYWLDAARYADTHGMHFDNYREMHPYRDWVIRSFNSNQPFDEFYVEQLAGDLLEEPTEDQLIATGFLRCNMTTNEGGTIADENLAIYAADRVQTFGWVFLGLTTNCAQCHDHKFDQFSMKDYYSLAAFFRNIEHPSHDGNHKAGKGPTMVVPLTEDASSLQSIEDQIANLKSKVAEFAPRAREDLPKWRETLTRESLTSTDSIAIESESVEPGILLPLDLNERETRSGLWSDQVSLVPHGDPKFKINDKELPSTRGAVEFTKDDSIEAIDLPHTDTSQPFSISLWIKPYSNFGTRTVLSQSDPAKEHQGWEIWTRKRQLHLTIRGSNKKAVEVRSQGQILNANRWNHITLTYDGSHRASGLRLFVDGKPSSLDTIQDSLKTLKDPAVINNPLRIGNREGLGGFEGRIREVQLSHRILSPWAALRAATIERVVSALATNKEDKKATNTIRDFYIRFVHQDTSGVHLDLADLEAQRGDIISRSPITHIAREKKGPAKTNMLMRGEYDNPGDEVLANTPSALHSMPDDAPKNRLGLARWVVDPSNPLTARVTVNRFWQEVFGRGIVETPDDFGVTGSLPSNQALLDHLALDFVNSGWDVQAFFKNIFTSQTYRQAAIATPEKINIDPTNALVSRGPRFRMDAEMIRDQALEVSGLLSRKMYGPGVKPYQPSDIWSIVGLPGGDTRNYVESIGEDLHRRTLYNFWKRMAPPPNMETFGAPNRENCTVRRERTNTPLQALVALNDETFVEAARVLATTVVEDLGGFENSDPQSIAGVMGERLLARPLGPAESSIIEESFSTYLDHYSKHPKDAAALIAVGVTPTNEQLEPSTLAAWTMVANQLMNLDEVLCK
ncbi:MAG: DUF1553 domain-containing protein [Planctomycetota bacterium]